jgi:TolA-binding protein
LILGKSYVLQKRYAKALGELRRFVDLYPKSRNRPEALYLMANAFFLLGDCTDANVLADTVVSRYAQSPFAVKAQKLKEQIETRKARCTS